MVTYETNHSGTRFVVGFSAFTGLRLGFFLLAVIAHEAIGPLVLRGLAKFQEPRDYSLLFSLADATLIVVYLWWPPLPRLLGRMFLPLGLFITTVGAIVGGHLEYLSDFNQPGPEVLVGAWKLTPILFIPLVLTGWQYDFRAVILFCSGTALFDAGLTFLVIDWHDPNFLPTLAVIAVRTISFALVGYMIGQLVTAQRKQRQALAQANAQLGHYAAALEQLTISRERNRLARELHDTLAHTLSGLAIQLEAVSVLWDTDSSAARTMIDQSLATTRTGLTETRRALQALRAKPLEDLGLALAIRHLAESVVARTGSTLDLRVSKRLDDLGPDVEQCIYRVAQEALANVEQHAGARHLTVQLDSVDQQLTLTITDDGRGFAPSDVNPSEQFGLKDMKERTKMAGGTFEAESRPGQGTTICLIVPTGHAMEDARDTRVDL